MGGGGPAGLMAAEELARAGLQVSVAEQMPTMGRKLLMAGKSGLNMTKAEPREAFDAAYGARPEALRAALEAFGFQQAVGQVAAQFLRRHAIGAQRLEQQRNRRERRLELVSRGG